MTALEIFRLIAAEYSAMTDEQLQPYIDLAGSKISESKFKGRYNEALAYLTAHMIKLSSNNQTASASGLAGIVKSEKTGDLAIEYQGSNTFSVGAMQYTSTPYGAEFYAIMKSCVIPITNRMVGEW